ncbi:1604_t:CDS:2 [Paraglomus brasilianum]|uniref:1604_t:CDS:1 n=1 Tax=Paraglomus brasilianum TaxID=144538 RepID=A0A9N9FK18_9GLOM|nr:1604_t:CDS:2 [Paraglomus brasilianum]
MSSAYAYPGYTNMPAPSENVIPQQPPRVYRLEVSQQPIRARMCGFGEKDRRPIDPPPVVRLIMTTPDGKPIPER